MRPGKPKMTLRHFGLNNYKWWSLLRETRKEQFGGKSHEFHFEYEDLNTNQIFK